MKKIVSTLLVALFVLAANCAVAQGPQQQKVQQMANQKVQMMDGIVSLNAEQKQQIKVVYTEYAKKELEANKLGKGTPEYKAAMATAKKGANRGVNKTLTPEQLKMWQDHWAKKSKK